jgi:protein-tyrosine phosphatase
MKQTRARAVAREFGVDLHSHRSRRVTRDLLQAADVVVAMDFATEAKLIALERSISRKIVLLGAFAPQKHWVQREITDPYHGKTEDVRRCFGAIEACVTRLAQSFLARDAVP